MATADDSERHRNEGSSLFVASVYSVSERRAVHNNCGNLN